MTSTINEAYSVSDFLKSNAEEFSKRADGADERAARLEHDATVERQQADRWRKFAAAMLATSVPA